MTRHVTRMAPYAEEANRRQEPTTRRGAYYSRSIIRLKFDEGPWNYVGVAARPLYLKQPTGWRKFPDTATPLRLKTPDGPWVDVIQNP